MTFDVLVVLYVGLIGALALLMVRSALENAIEKTCVYLFIVVHTFYSGLGIARPENDKKYLVHFTVFMFCLVVGLRLGFFLLRKKEKLKSTDSLGKELTQIAKIGTFIYFIILFIPLIYPANRLPDLLRVVINIKDIFERRAAYKSNMVLYMLFTLKLMLLPLVYVHMNKMKSTIKIVLMLLLILYIEVVQAGYIGRAGLLSQLFILCGCAIIHRSERLRGREQDKESAEHQTWLRIRKLILITAICLILSMPLLQSFSILRHGRKSSLTTKESIEQLLKIETGFPNHYPYCEEYAREAIHHSKFSAVRYMEWIITLPIPKFLSSSEDAVNLNYHFSELRTGHLYGTPNFFVLLPSLLGEGILLYGAHFFWLHGIFLGLLIAIVIRLLTSIRALRYWSVYIALSIVLMARGGSQGAIAVIVNYTLIAWLLGGVVLLRRYAKSFLNRGKMRLNNFFKKRIREIKENRS